MKEFIVTVDGPAGSGKSTIAKIIAKKYGFTYLDTGATVRFQRPRHRRGPAPA